MGGNRGIPGLSVANLVHFLPGLQGKSFAITSPVTPLYNCIAWAADDSTHWWWPDFLSYWPSGVPREETLEAFALAFESIGYEQCGDGTIEIGFDKVVLFADAGLNPTHAAKQLPSGEWWTSKCGPDEDIVHTIESISGAFYGRAVRYLRRRR
jgi:hypothetical protein